MSFSSHSMSRSNKLKMSTYTKRLIKKNIGYFVALIFFGFLLFTFIPVQVTSYITVRSELSKTNNDIQDLDARRNTIQEFTTSDLEDLVLTLNTLYPSVEDRFSIFTALENLQGVTGINIVSYSSPFAGRSLNEISISVKASADMTAYRRFLRDHVYRSGRFMTVERIVYSAKDNGLNFTAKFYSRNVNLEGTAAEGYSPQYIERLRQIQKEVDSSGLVRKNTSNEDVVIPVDYSTKQNPFE